MEGKGKTGGGLGEEKEEEEEPRRFSVSAENSCAQKEFGAPSLVARCGVCCT